MEDSELRRYVDAVSGEIRGLWLYFLFFQELFNTSPERIDQLNAAASGAFGLFQRSLQFTLLMYVARILDPPSLGKFENLSLP